MLGWPSFGGFTVRILVHFLLLVNSCFNTADLRQHTQRQSCLQKPGSGMLAMCLLLIGSNWPKDDQRSGYKHSHSSQHRSRVRKSLRMKVLAKSYLITIMIIINKLVKVVNNKTQMSNHYVVLQLHLQTSSSSSSLLVLFWFGTGSPF